MNKKEEGQRLLGNQNEDSDEEILFSSYEPGPAKENSCPPLRQAEEDPLPSYNIPEAAPLTTIPLTDPLRDSVNSASVGDHPVLPVANPVPASEAPPDYYLHTPKSDALPAKAGLAVHIQMDGRLVPGTVMEDPSGRHMVYICQPQTGNPSNPADKPPPPKDYLALSLLSLVCCCAPLGLVALLKSLEVQRLYRIGDYTGAARASREAHGWGSAAVVIGATIFLIVFALKVYYSEVDSNTHYYYY